MADVKIREQYDHAVFKAAIGIQIINHMGLPEHIITHNTTTLCFGLADGVGVNRLKTLNDIQHAINKLPNINHQDPDFQNIFYTMCYSLMNKGLLSESKIIC